MKGIAYSGESYVRFYTRDTPSWNVLGWEAQALYPQIRRKVDRAGVLDLGDELRAEGLGAVLQGWPIEVVERGLDRLIAKGWGQVAGRIVAAARQQGVPVKEEPDLAQVLSRLDLGQEVPPELYEVVARVLAFIYRMNRES